MDLPAKKIKIIRRAVRAMNAPSQEPTDSNGELVGLLAAMKLTAQPKARRLASLICMPSE